MKKPTTLLAMCLLAFLMIHTADARRRLQCAPKKNGKILSGRTCRFRCCLAMEVRKMVLTTPANLCPRFRKIGKPCFVNGTRYPHKWVIKYNRGGCIICDNGKEIFYDDAEYNGGSRLDGYTLIRFG
eukprot:Seg1088.2 transcript_id=Seg1088.2/GoldUCD/mRNA.D3Y31 product="hypothetical protein" protein_id=Seg1088.2/GoldUCD/D3Y31